MILTLILLVAPSVALRKESVDRNTGSESWSKSLRVALRKESVDRNAGYRRSSPLASQSLSARRAWIEIIPCCGSKDEH